MENLSKQASFNRKTASLLLCFLLGGTSLMAFAAPAGATISIDQVSPIDGSISISNPYMAVGANISGEESASVGVNSSSEWLAGTFDNNTIVGAAGTLQLRVVSRDDFQGTGDPDADFWTWSDNAVQGSVTDFLSLYTDVGSGVDSARIMGTSPFPLNTMQGLYLNASASVVSSGMYVSAAIIGWWSTSPSMSYCAIVFMEDGAGGYLLDFIAQDDNFGYQSGSGFSPVNMINLGSVENYRIYVSDAAAGNLTAEWYDAGAQAWVDLGTVMLDLANFGPYVPFAGADFPAFDDWAMDIDFIEVGVTIYAASGSYLSAPIDNVLGNGAHIGRISLATTNNQLNGIGSVQWRSAPNDTGPWTVWMTAALNVPVDLMTQKWIQFQITLSRAANPSWVDAVVFELFNRNDVGMYHLDDLPGSGPINTDVWSASSTAVGNGGLTLDSASGSASVGVTYRNTTWLLSDTHSVRTMSSVTVWDGNDLGAGGAADTNMLLSGFTASDGASQTGFIGVVRIDDGASPYWGVVWDDGTGRRSNFDTNNIIQTAQSTLILVTLVDGMFHASVLESDNGWRGWLDLGTYDWGATPGTASLRIGDIGSHSGGQSATLDWAAVQMKALTPVFGAAWTAGNVNINENENTRAVIAVNGPDVDMEIVNYRLDTTPPVGTETLNGGEPFTQSVTVDLDLDATDRWGVQFYAASESLSFPEGWDVYTTSSSFTLSPGDGRKVVWVRFMDSSGVVSSPINQSVVLDSQNPTGAIYVANRSAYSNTIDVAVDLLAFDANGIETLYLSNDQGMANAVAYDVNPGVAPTASTETVTWSLLPGDGTKKVFFQVEDVAGRRSIIYNDTILVDTTAPGLTASITNGVVRGTTTYVNTASLRVNVEASDASGVAEVQISETSDFAVFESYTGAGSLTYDVPAVSGAKTIYVRSFDIYGLMSTVRRLDFFVDVNAPTGSVDIIYTGQTMADFLLNVPGCCNETNLAKARGVVLVVSAVDNVEVSEVQFSTSLYFPGAVWQHFTAGRYFFELSANDGTDKTVYVRFRDINGNPSQAFFDQIDMDTTQPTGSIIVNSGDFDTIDPLLSLSLEASDNFEGTLEMRLSLTPDFSGSTWLPFADSARFDARTTAGEVTVYYQVRDANGWESVTYSDKITVRLATCQELNNCPIVGSPGFEGAYSALALVAVAAVALLARRRKTGQ